jgi:23S rRNA (adenine-N6)-dimethyltransferase
VREGHRAWGWHRLDPVWATRVVAAADIRPGGLVLDIGAGEGALCGPLLEAGARVIAVERHPERARELRRRFGAGLRVVEADAADLRLPTRPFAVVASPPFVATSAILRRLLHRGTRMTSAHLVLQSQAARRWHAPSAPGRGRWSIDFTTELAWSVPRTAFTPPPHVDSRLLIVQRRTRV